MDEMLVLVIVFLALWGGHWMPWAAIPGLTSADGKLHRLLAYGYGCAIIFLGFVLWARDPGQPLSFELAVRFLGYDIVAAGLGTVTPRCVRWLYEQRQGCRQAEDYEQTRCQ